MRMGRTAFSLLLCAGLVAACGDGNYAAETDNAPRGGSKRQFDPNAPTVFGDGGFSVGNINSSNVGNILGNQDEKARLPVNKYLWQASLEIL